MREFEKTDRSRVRRIREYARYDAQTVHAVLDARRNRRRLTRTVLILALAAAAGVVACVAAMRPRWGSAFLPTRARQQGARLSP